MLLHGVLHCSPELRHPHRADWSVPFSLSGRARFACQNLSDSDVCL